MQCLSHIHARKQVVDGDSATRSGRLRAGEHVRSSLGGGNLVFGGDFGIALAGIRDIGYVEGRWIAMILDKLKPEWKAVLGTE
jgi:hypothetical protein